MKLRFLWPCTWAVVVLCLPGCQEVEPKHEEHVEHHHKIVVTNPIQKNITTSEQYVSQIHSCRHIEVRALETGYLEKIPVREGTGSQGRRDDVHSHPDTIQGQAGYRPG